MAVSKFYAKCEDANLAKIMREKGYEFFTNGSYNLNIIGIRSDQQNKVTNLYDDLLVVIYKTPNETWTKQIYKITTEPGTYYMTEKLLNPKGTSIMVPGQYRGCYAVGKHRGKYEALVQKKAIKVYRDNNKDKTYNLKPETIETGVFGINIHRSNEFKETEYVNKYSAGCQVFANPDEFNSFMRLCELQNKQFSGNSFTYTLINESDIIYFLSDLINKSDKLTPSKMIKKNKKPKESEMITEAEMCMLKCMKARNRPSKKVSKKK